jgi:hypothetical protein
MKWKKVPSLQSFRVLKHPLLAVGVGGLISALLAPYITDQWQNHQKELEVKTDLIGRISQATAAIISVTQLLGLPGVNMSQISQTDAYLNWETSSATIGSQLRAYFPDTQLDQDWGNYSAIMVDFFSLPTINTPCKRLEHVQNIQTYMFDNIVPARQSYNCRHNENVQNIQRSHYFINSDKIDWITLVTRGHPSDRINWKENVVEAANSTEQYGEAFYALKQKMLNQKDVIVRRIIQSHIPAF